MASWISATRKVIRPLRWRLAKYLIETDFLGRLGGENVSSMACLALSSGRWLLLVYYVECVYVSVSRAQLR